MKKDDFKIFVDNNFDGKTKELMISQIENFYQISAQKTKNRKYKIGDDVILGKNNLMTGFKLNIPYLK